MYFHAHCIVFVLVVVYVTGKMVYNFTLTSAITRPHTIPKTTKFMKRRNMDSILFKAAPQIELPAIDRRKIC